MTPHQKWKALRARIESSGASSEYVTKFFDAACTAALGGAMAAPDAADRSRPVIATDAMLTALELTAIRFGQEGFES